MCQQWADGGWAAESWLVDRLHEIYRQEGIYEECKHLVRLVGHAKDCKLT